MKKKVLSLVLALLMTASAASTVLADEATAIADEPVAVEAVADEVEAGQYDKAIEFLANYKIFKGYSADDTGAEDLIQRYQMALFVGRIATGWVEDEQWEDGPENWSEFSDIDVEPVNKYYGALSFANQKGIIQGYGNGKFGPTDSITYQDALTMVVRTLGYTGLDWPWGYIQKAVELGLTDGITGVAYTDELTRGEVAQIIYNALFATTKNGTTLAMSSFGIEFGWEKVVITASDLNIFTKDNEEAYKKLESNNAYSLWDKSQKTSDGYVAFKLLNDDGSLGDDTYYVQSTELGLADGVNNHDDEAVVGDAYYILFEKDEDSELVKVVAYESLLVDTLVNEGKTDDEGEDQDYPIETFKDEYTLVTKYSSKAYVNTTKTGKPEVMVFNGVGGITEEYIAGNYIAIDWETGDILEPTKDDNGNFIVNDDGEYEYTVAWNYSDVLGKYYRYLYDEADEDGIYSGKNNGKTGSYDEAFAIDYMTDAEFEKYYASLNWTAKKNYKGFAQAVESLTKSAYASLELFDTDLDGVADRGIYESYRLGYFTEDVIWCGSCGKNIDSYLVKDVNTLANAYESADMYNDKTDDNDGDVVKVEYEAIIEGVACSHIVDRAWFVEGYEPEIAYDEDGEEDGYKAGYVIYNRDAETGAIKVVKNVNDGSDEDSFVATGVVRAYNVAKGTVTIGDTQYSIKDYDELEGNGFKYVTANWKTRAQYTGLLRNLFNQFVEYVVVDGELVAIRAKSATKAEVIIVDSYAGLSNDGYIVVNGYSSSDLEYDRFRIGSYDGWMKGDYYYYLTEAKAEASFSKGAIYAITSYNAEEDVYYVELAGAFDEDGNYDIDSDAKLDNLGRTVTINATDEGYFEYYDSETKKTTSVKMKDSDKFVIIPKNVEGKPFATVKVYEGKLGEDWTVTGNVINTTDPNKRTYVIVNATDINGFVDTYKSGLVVLLSDKYISVDYNGADAEGWYLLGATEVEVEVFNLFNGKEENVILPGTNIDLEVGHVYFTQDNVLVEDLGVLAIADTLAIAMDAYGDIDADSAEYFFGQFPVTEKNYANLFEDIKGGLTRKEFIAGASFGLATYDLGRNEEVNFFYKSLNEKLGHSKYRNTIDEIAVFGVEYDGDEIESIKSLSKKDFKKLVEDYDEYVFTANYVYDIDSTDIVIYVSLVEEDFTTVVEADEVVYSNPVKVGGNADAYVEAQIGYKTITTTVGGTVIDVEAVVDGILLTVDGYLVDDATHANVHDNKWYFGYEGDCINEVTDIAIDFNDTALLPVYSCIVEETYGEVSDCDVKDGDCDLIKTVYIPFVASEIKDGKQVGKEVVITDAEGAATVEVTINGVTYTTVLFDLDTTISSSKVLKVNDGFKTVEITTPVFSAITIEGWK